MLGIDLLANIEFSSEFHPGESLNISYLSPFLKALGSNYTSGANFASAGAATQPRDVPFALHIQVQEFLYFRDRSLELIDQGLLNSDQSLSLESISTNLAKMRTTYTE